MAGATGWDRGAMPIDDATRSASAARPVFTAERTKAFADAVVAIAMTLLILPLMESIGEAAETHSAIEWIGEHVPQLVSFVLSFWIIAMFWLRHHQLFERVERVTNPLLWWTVLWMLTIVWLPVATAMSGQMESEPSVQIVYIGSMLAASIALLITRLYLRAHPELHAMDTLTLRRGAAADLSMALLFVAACVVAVLVPVIGYFALFLLMLVGPLARLLMRTRFAR